MGSAEAMPSIWSGGGESFSSAVTSPSRTDEKRLFKRGRYLRNLRNTTLEPGPKPVEEGFAGLEGGAASVWQEGAEAGAVGGAIEDAGVGVIARELGKAARDHGFAVAIEFVFRLSEKGRAGG